MTFKVVSASVARLDNYLFQVSERVDSPSTIGTVAFLIGAWLGKNGAIKHQTSVPMRAILQVPAQKELCRHGICSGEKVQCKRSCSRAHRRSRRPKDHIVIRILHSDPKAKDKGIPESVVCRILVFMLSFGPLKSEDHGLHGCRDAHLQQDTTALHPVGRHTPSVSAAEPEVTNLGV